MAFSSRLAKGPAEVLAVLEEEEEAVAEPRAQLDVEGGPDQTPASINPVGAEVAGADVALPDAAPVCATAVASSAAPSAVPVAATAVQDGPEAASSEAAVAAGAPSAIGDAGGVSPAPALGGALLNLEPVGVAPPSLAGFVAQADASPCEGWPEAAEDTEWPQAEAPDAAAAPAPPPRSPPREKATDLRELVAQLRSQLAEEARRREDEEAELEERAAEKKRLREEIETLQRRRAAARHSAMDADAAAAEARQQHAELLALHEDTRSKAAKQQEELIAMRQAAEKMCRDWARDGPEKDALVATKMQIAQAHDQLAQVRLRHRTERDNLQKQIADLSSSCQQSG